MPGGWGCPHEVDGYCKRLKLPCDVGIPGCVLHGRFLFADPAKNPKRRSRKNGECQTEASDTRQGHQQSEQKKRLPAP